jgi:DHA1 family bicyclomycin/chloramphenicol resistance-like MFS transporter
MTKVFQKMHLTKAINTTREANIPLGIMILPLLASVMAISPLAIDMYLPAMPTLVKELSTNSRTIQLSVSLYFLGCTVGMFLFGSLSDQCGRRPMLIIGLLGFSVMSLFLGLNQSATGLLILRFFQAVFGGSVIVIVPSIIRDIYDKNTAKYLSYLMMITMVAPLIAPSIGAAMIYVMSWHFIFFILGGYAVVLTVLIIWRLPETSPKPSRQSNSSSSRRQFITALIDNYKIVLSNKQTRPYIVISMLSAMSFFGYLTSIPFIYMSIFGVDEIIFGILFGVNAVFLVLAHFINTRIINYYDTRAILVGAALLSTMTILGLLLTLIFLTINLIVFVIVLSFFLGFLAILRSNANALVLIAFKQQTGTASAVLGVLRFGCGALVGPILAVLYNATPIPLIALMFVLMCIVMIFLQHPEVRKKA